MTVDSLKPEEGEGVRAIGGGKVQGEDKSLRQDCPKKRGSEAAGQWTKQWCNSGQWTMDKKIKF